MELVVGEILTEAVLPGNCTLLGNNCVQTNVPPSVEGTAVNDPVLPEQIVIELTVTVGF